MLERSRRKPYPLGQIKYLILRSYDQNLFTKKCVPDEYSTSFFFIRSYQEPPLEEKNNNN